MTTSEGDGAAPPGASPGTAGVSAADLALLHEEASIKEENGPCTS
jgi:hypothetical protein